MSLRLSPTRRLNLYSAPDDPPSRPQHLIGEGVAHDEGRMAHGAAQVDQSALGQDDDVTAVFQKEAIDLRRRRRRRRVNAGGTERPDVKLKIQEVHFQRLT